MHGLLCSNKMQKDKANNQDLMTMYQKDHHSTRNGSLFSLTPISSRTYMIHHHLFVRFPFIFHGGFALFFLNHDAWICVNESAKGWMVSPYDLWGCASWVYNVGSLGEQLNEKSRQFLFASFINFLVFVVTSEYFLWEEAWTLSVFFFFFESSTSQLFNLLYDRVAAKQVR